MFMHLFARLRNRRISLSYRIGRRGTAHRDYSEFECECLESRTMLAGNVTATLTGGGDLNIRGDNSSNHIQITPYGAGVRISGADGTTINNSSVAYFGAITDDLRIVMRNGNNVVQLCGVQVGDDMSIRTGSGNDTVLLKGDFSVGDDVSIGTSGGNDIVALGDPIISDDLSVNTGSGDDVVVWENGYVYGDSRFNLGSGSDVVVMGEDLIAYGGFSIVTGSGDDFVGLGLDDVEVYGRASVNLGSGNDELVLHELHLYGPSQANGGGGYDELTTSTETEWYVDPVYGGFESLGVGSSSYVSDLIQAKGPAIVTELLSRVGTVITC